LGWSATIPHSAQKSSISCVSASPPTNDPAMLPRCMISSNALRSYGLGGAPNRTSGLKPKSFNNHLTMLRKALSVAVDSELLSHLRKVRW